MIKRRRYIIFPSRRGIEDMEVAALMNNKNNPSQKDDGGAPSGGKVLMGVAIVLENKKNKTESIRKTNKGESVPTDGDIDEI